MPSARWSSTSGRPGAARARWSRRRWRSWPRSTTASVDVVKVDVDANPQLSQTFSIMSIPTIAFFKPGAQPQGVVGFRPLEQLEQQFGLTEFGGRRGRLTDDLSPTPRPRSPTGVDVYPGPAERRAAAANQAVARSIACSSRSRGANVDPVGAAFRRGRVRACVQAADRDRRVEPERDAGCHRRTGPRTGRAVPLHVVGPVARSFAGDALDSVAASSSTSARVIDAAARIASRSAACSS